VASRAAMPSTWLDGGYLQDAGMPAPRSIAEMVAATPDVLPPATAARQIAAACIMYVFVGSGALLEFC
jgi:hypothetical protein